MGSILGAHKKWNELSKEVRQLYLRIDELHLEWINKDVTGEPGIDDVTREYHDVVRQIELFEGEFDPPIDCVLPPEYMPEPYRSNLIRRLIDGDPVLLLLFDLPENPEQYLQDDQRDSSTNG